MSLLDKARRLRGVELYDYQPKFVERVINALEQVERNGGLTDKGIPIEGFSRNTILFIDRMYDARFR